MTIGILIILPVVLSLTLLFPLAPPALTLCDRVTSLLVVAMLEDEMRRLCLRSLAALDALVQEGHLAARRTSSSGPCGTMATMRKLRQEVAPAPLEETLLNKVSVAAMGLGLECIGSFLATAVAVHRRRASLAPPSGGVFAASNPFRTLATWRISSTWVGLVPHRRIRQELRQGLAHRDCPTTSTPCSVTLVCKIAMGGTFMRCTASAAMHGRPGAGARLTRMAERRN